MHHRNDYNLMYSTYIENIFKPIMIQKIKISFFVVYCFSPGENFQIFSFLLVILHQSGQHFETIH